jgi:hypothetical protein
MDAQLVLTVSVKVGQAIPQALLMSELKPGAGKAFTVMFCVAVSPQPPLIEYVTVLVPAMAGLNVPATGSVIPVPDHVPPAVAADKLKGADPAQTGETAVIVAFAAFVTVMFVVSAAAHVPEIV